MALHKRAQCKKNRGGPHFSVPSLFLFQNKVISKKKVSLLIYVQILCFRRKTVVFSKKMVITINRVHNSDFLPEVKVQTGGHRHGATIKK